MSVCLTLRSGPRLISFQSRNGPRHVGSSTDSDTVYTVHACAACFAHGRDETIRLMD